MSSDLPEIAHPPPLDAWRWLQALLPIVLLGCATATPKPVGRHADIGPLHMYYEDSGQGRPVVLLHGGGSTAQTTFGAVMPVLARTHRVIAPEQQGHGHTADLDRPMSFEQMADDTADLLGQLRITDADVIGFSNGGMVALQLAVRHPALVRRLVICSGYYARDGVVPALAQAWEQAPDPSKMPTPLRDAYLAAAPQPNLEAFMQKTLVMLRTFTDLTDRQLATITVPVLVMAGDHDVIRVEHTAALARLVPHGELAIFPGSVHGTYLGAAEGAKPGSLLPAIATSMIEAFLQGSM